MSKPNKLNSQLNIPLLPSSYQQSVLKKENSDLSASTTVKNTKQSRAPSTGQSKFYK